MKRLDFLIHRWLGVGLGIFLLGWVLSGLVLLAYVPPGLTESARLARLPALAPELDLVSFGAAVAGARDPAQPAGSPGAPDAISGGRLMRWNDRPVYLLWRTSGRGERAVALVDARSGALLGPISRGAAIAAARRFVGAMAPVRSAARLERGDLYLLSAEYQGGFPAWAVRFDDPAATTAYVSIATGELVGLVNRRTRWTTWLGAVPHWLYFPWLYTGHYSTWLRLSLVLPALGAVAALTGILYGMAELVAGRRMTAPRASRYRGVSRWHHLAGLVFGVFVLGWTASGFLEVLGPDGYPSSVQVARARGAPPPGAWLAPPGRLPVTLPDPGSVPGPAPAATAPADSLVAVDFTSLEGRAGYLLRFRSGTSRWLDGDSGTLRGELDAGSAARIAGRVLGPAAPAARGVERLAGYDAYYYARPLRERPLPVWRVRFGDRGATTVYLDAVSGRPAGFVSAEARRYRWWRDGLHTWDLPGLNPRPPLRLALLLPIMLGAALSAGTGCWLAGRRLRRLLRPRAISPGRGPRPAVPP